MSEHVVMPVRLSARPFIVIAGPTASGKSALALDIAQHCPAVIINADSMQLYQDLSVLTARPSADDMAAAPHRLYGVCDASERCSVGQWLALARECAEQAWQESRLPVLVGGTGMYVNAAISGISPIPDVPDEVRAEVADLREEIGVQPFFDRLRDVDPVLGERLYPTDSQRVLRAMEVYRHTGTPLSQWQRLPPTGQINGLAIPVAHIPPREHIYQKINTRFEMMAEDGALDEVRQLLKRNLDPSLPAMKALGVSALAAYLNGATSREEAVSLAQRDSRHYAKRQMTWIRNNFISKIENQEIYSKRLSEEIFAKIVSFC